MGSKCPMCRRVEENLDHLLLHCPLRVCPRFVKDLSVEWSYFPIMSVFSSWVDILDVEDDTFVRILLCIL